MSKFFKALEQAERDRALMGGKRPESLAPRVAGAPAGGPAHTPPEAPEGVEEHLVSLLTPASFEAEQYRALRHTVEQLHKTGGLRVVAVSSPAVEEGKTTTAINLAGALAQAPDARVLLVDADLRRPSLARFVALPAPGAPGLVNAILDPGLALERIVQPRPPFNLSVVPAGQPPPSPYDLLKSPRLGGLLDEARQGYDYVVLDAPPLCPVQDCRVIARWVDGFLVVVAAHRTPRRLVEEALNVVERAKMIGLVFNEDDDPAAAYGSYYGYYRGYPRAGENGGGRRWSRSARRLGRLVGQRREEPP
jgi:capsular exopolysaccharide synthesis family protein